MIERANSADFALQKGHRLDMGVESAYTTEFLDGPEGHAMWMGHR
jgi:hypothetical protein